MATTDSRDIMPFDIDTWVGRLEVILESLIELAEDAS